MYATTKTLNFVESSVVCRYESTD